MLFLRTSGVTIPELNLEGETSWNSRAGNAPSRANDETLNATDRRGANFMTRRLDVCLTSLLLLSVSLVLTGCTLETTATPGVEPGVTLQGLVHGGQQGVAGAHVYLLAANNAGYGGSGIAPSTANASSSLLKFANTGLTDSIGAYVLSGNFGQFTITGDYTCPTAGTQVYLYTLGGDVGSGVNSGAGFLEALGPCGNLTSSTNVYVDEITTVAAAYAFAGFATDATHVGSSATTLAQTGVANAFATATNLVNATTGVALATTPNGNGTVPQLEINALANSLAGCVNSNTTGFTQCTTLFKNATNDGVTCTVPPCADEPTDTASAAINIAHFPSKNVATIFGLAAGIGTPFLPALSAAPNDWTIAISFTGAGLTQGYTAPQCLAVDGSGNLWVVTGLGSVLSEFSPLGIPANANGYTGLGLNSPDSVALDVNSAHVWISNFSGDNVVNFTISGGAHVAYTTVSGSGPATAQIDGSGNVWIANISTSKLLKMNPSTGAFSPFTGNGLGFPGSLAIEPGAAGNIWVGDGTGGDNASLFSNSGGAVNAFTNTGGINQPFDVAIDAGGNAWFANSFTNTVSKLTPTGSSGSSFATVASGNEVQGSLAIDGAGNIWISSNNFNGTPASDNAIFEFSNAGTTLSGATGYKAVPALEPNSIAVDGSGNVWYTDESPDGSTIAPGTLRELVGAAVPVVTPTAYGAANTMLGTRP